MKGGGVGKRKIGKHKKTGSHKQADREEFLRRHIDQIWEDVRKEGNATSDRGVGPVGTSNRVPLDEDIPGQGQHYCRPCSRYFVNEYAMRTHEATKPHKRRVKELQGARPHDQREADWAGGLGSPDNGSISLRVLGGVADIAL